MPVDAACRAASTGPAMFDLCMRILRSLPPNSELVTYAVGAAGAAGLSCVSTMDAGKRMLGMGPSGCVADYSTTCRAISGAADQLGRCAFADLRQGYMDAMAAIEDCTAKLAEVGGTSTPFYGMVLGNWDRTVTVFRLATSHALLYYRTGNHCRIKMSITVVGSTPVVILDSDSLTITAGPGTRQ
ncbi:hypothetical protein BAE44_0024936 [Dichanthelium oligosanthes]|uniref:Pectinesterase inhibitor domain-containing protein n=1 Tax=Dichanthelium oligosanthes TaxID=888268 RepID=A0A1E5UMN0_9POAL|nr:hypothetical protein BAE44_0024936 [Dichanthelium oligosanthes]